MGAESKLSAEAAARFVLGLSQGCSKEDVKRAFRRLALVFHPDKNKGQNEEEATKRFQAIATAKDLLLGTCLSGTARPGPPVAKKPSVVVHWVCGACQMRHLGSLGSRTPEPCGRATSSTLCFCRHRLGVHELESQGGGAPKLRISSLYLKEWEVVFFREFPCLVRQEAERHLNTFKVCIRHSGGKNLHLEASPGETVKDLKRRLEESWGILSKEQRLLCRGALMVDERSLGSYDLQVDGAVIVFAPQLRLRQANGTKSRGPGKVMPYDAARGFLMVPGLEKWRPETAGKTNVEEADLFFDSQKSPAPWQIRSRDFTQVR
ncbi:unnamed protein product [Durusdinium trenchii]|uniref:J domain-containing protein n=1 Tax=Durusdinium trenchii TaxID=1381693 RepID=A0ABP0PP39_9DINO